MIAVLSLASPNSLVGLRIPPSSSRRRLPRTAAAPRAMAASSPAPPSTLYDVLGLQASATVREIKVAYRRLARECHPDVKGEPSADEFIRLHQAYTTLSDPDRRAQYDLDMMAAASIGRQRRPPFSSGFYGSPRRTWETDQCW